MRSRLFTLVLSCAFALMQTLVVIHSFEHLTPTKSQVAQPEDASSLAHNCPLCFAATGLLAAFPLGNALSISDYDKVLAATTSSDYFLFRSHLLGYFSRAPPLLT